MSSERFVIVGASLTGAKAAEALREEGYEGEIVLLGEEAVRPYERPPLSKDYLRGESELAGAFVHGDEDFYDQKRIDLRLEARVNAVDPGARTVTLDGGETLSYERLLLATGAYPRHLSIPGAESERVHYLRSATDSQQLHEAITHSSRVVVIGAGWIGCEVAASARALGAQVTVIEVAKLPLGRVLGPELGRFYADLHAEHGVELRMGVGVDGIVSAEDGVRVTLSDGGSVEGDMIVAGIGAAPRTELAEAAGLTLENGVITDEHLTTSATGVLAAGDVANVWYPHYKRHIRLEHWSAALNQGPVAARNMLGLTTAYDRIPYFFSDQYDVGMEYTGLAGEGAQVVFRGEAASREFIAFWLEDGVVVAGMNVNVWDVAETIEKLIRARQPVPLDRLTDPSVPLDELIASS